MIQSLKPKGTRLSTAYFRDSFMKIFSKITKFVVFITQERKINKLNVPAN